MTFEEKWIIAREMEKAYIAARCMVTGTPGLRRRKQFIAALDAVLLMLKTQGIITGEN